MLVKISEAVLQKQAKDIIGCIGKLPVQTEFIRCNVDNQNLKQLETWLQEGFLHINRELLIRNQGREALHLNHNLLLNYGIGRKPIVAYLHDSQDSDGRSYPLLLFQELSNVALSNNQHHLPLLYEKLYVTFASFFTKPWSGKTAHDFLTQFIPCHSLIPPIDVDLIHEKMIQVYSQMNYQFLWQHMMGEESFRCAHKLLANLIGLLNKISSQGSWQINLPIANSSARFISIGFWLSVLHKMRALNYRNMHLAWPATINAEPATLTIYHGNLNIAFFRSLLKRSDARISQFNLLNEYLADQSVEFDFDSSFDAHTSVQAVIDRFGKKDKRCKERNA